MFKKSITRIEKENESSQAELSNPALHDIIATNHVVFAKKPREGRLSRACKALIIMLILGLVAIGIIVLTLVLAHSRNTLMAIISRSIEENPISPSNNSRILFINEKNSTTITNEHTENENWSKMTTVSLTSNNLQTLTTTQNVHISSSVMRTKQQYERIPINTQSQSMKPYPSLNTIVNDQSTISTMTTTIQTTISNQETTFLPNIHDATTEIMMTTIDKLITTMGSEEDNQTSLNDPMTSTVDSTSTLIQNETTSVPEETSFTTYFTRHFNIQSSTINNADKQKTSKIVKKFPKQLIEDDVIDDFLF